MTKVSQQTVVFFGGNRRNENGPLLTLAQEMVKKGVKVIVLTDDFHWNLPTGNGKPLSKRLEEIKCEGLEWVVTPEITPQFVSRFIEDDTIGLSLNSVWMIKNEIVDLFGGRLFNYHNAKLPQERGAAIYSWKILSQSTKGTLTIHKITPKLDAGEIVKEKEISFSDKCSIPADYYRDMEKQETSFLMEFLEGKDLVSVQQDEAESIYMPRLHTLTNALINWDWSSKEIELFINAFDDPHEGAATFMDSRKLHLKKCSPAKGKENFHPFQAGLVYRKNPESLFVAAKGCGLEIGEVLDESGNNVLSKIKLGQRLNTPRKLLEEAQDHLGLPKWSQWWV